MVCLLLAAGCTTDGAAPEESADTPASAATPPGASRAPAQPCSEEERRVEECLELGVFESSGTRGDEDTARIREAQVAFWVRVNDKGGIDGARVVLRPVGEAGGHDPAEHPMAVR